MKDVMEQMAEALRNYIEWDDAAQGEGGGIGYEVQQSAREALAEYEATQDVPEDAVETVARAICVECEDHPDVPGDCRGNDYRWQDYAGTAREAMKAAAPFMQRVDVGVIRGVAQQLMRWGEVAHKEPVIAASKLILRAIGDKA